MWRYNMSAVCEINPFQFNVTFDIETSHLICTANQMTGFPREMRLWVEIG